VADAACGFLDLGTREAKNDETLGVRVRRVVALELRRTMKKRVLFLCTHNSSRSQMAEGLLRSIAGDRFDVFSAGTEKDQVQPLAIEAMRERGIDISGHSSKTLDAFLAQRFDYVITVCDQANESCPIFPGAARRTHWNFDDPRAATGSDEERLRVFRRVRDEIEARVSMFAAAEPGASTPAAGRPSDRCG
jgi:arsenate reductase